MTTQTSTIPNPVELAFCVDDAAPEIRAIFRDDLQRTLWLAVKCRHITNQYFNEDVRIIADSIRTKRPSNASDLHRRVEPITGLHWDDLARDRQDDFCEELFVYVVNVLDGGARTLLYREKGLDLKVRRS